MTSAELTARLRKLGYGIAHTRRKARSQELRAYVAVLHPEKRHHHELRWSPDEPDMVRAYEHRTPPGRLTQQDVFVGRVALDE